MKDLAAVDQAEVAAMYALLDDVKALRRSRNAFVQSAAERMTVILVDALYELDPTLADPWQFLLPEAEPLGERASS